MHVYLITNSINNKQYVGTEKGNNSEYFGSGRLIIEAIERFGKENFKKEILIDDRYIGSWKECLEFESACILSLNTLRPNGYNIFFWTWPMPIEICREAGRMGGKAAAKINMKQRTAIFAPENRGIGGKIGGKRTHELYPEKMKEWSGKGGKIAGKKLFKEKRGMFAPEVRSRAGKNSAHTLFEINGLFQRTTLGALFRM